MELNQVNEGRYMDFTKFSTKQVELRQSITLSARVDSQKRKRVFIASGSSQLGAANKEYNNLLANYKWLYCGRVRAEVRTRSAKITTAVPFSKDGICFVLFGSIEYRLNKLFSTHVDHV